MNIIKTLNVNSQKNMEEQIMLLMQKGQKYILLPDLAIKEQRAIFQDLKIIADECSITMLIKTTGETADSDMMLKVLSSMKGAMVYWIISNTTNNGEPYRTTYKALERFIKVVDAKEDSPQVQEGVVFIKTQGFKGILITNSD